MSDTALNSATLPSDHTRDEEDLKTLRLEDSDLIDSPPTLSCCFKVIPRALRSSWPCCNDWAEWTSFAGKSKAVFG